MQTIQAKSEIQSEVIGMAQVINHLETKAGVRPEFQSHYVNTQTKKHGIANLIIEILTAHGAMFKRNAEDTALRNVVVATSMLATDIEAEIKARFAAGSTRYPISSLRPYLVFMTTGNTQGELPELKGLLGKIQLKSHEDPDRISNKTRCKYYVVTKPLNPNPDTH